MRTGPRGADWIVASSRELKLSKTKVSLRAVLDKNQYGVFKRTRDFAVFKRGHSTEGNAKLIKDWGLKASEAPPCHHSSGVLPMLTSRAQNSVFQNSLASDHHKCLTLVLDWRTLCP